MQTLRDLQDFDYNTPVCFDNSTFDPITPYFDIFLKSSSFLLPEMERI